MFFASPTERGRTYQVDDVLRCGKDGRNGAHPNENSRLESLAFD